MSKVETQLDAFAGSLSPRLVEEITAQNPWWSGRSLPPLPRFRRWPFETLLKRLMRETPVARINVLRGPRQIGKTTLQYQLIEHLLAAGVDPKRILRVQFDELPSFQGVSRSEPIIRVVQWYERKILAGDLNGLAREGTPCLLFLDEVQNLPDWHVQLKALVDRTDVRLLVTGSSALRIELGRDSLAGRIQMLEVGPFRLSEIASVRGLGPLPAFEANNGHGGWAKMEFWKALQRHGSEHAVVRDVAFRAFSQRGGYPVAQNPAVEWGEVARQLNETVIKRVIRHDLRIGERGRRRDPKLLEEMFRMAARYCGQTPSIGKLAGEARETMEANVGVQRVRQYLEFLASALLIRTIEPHEMRLKKRRGAPKLCLSDHCLSAAWLDEIVPIDSEGLDADPSLSARIPQVARDFRLRLMPQIVYIPTR
jgi:predicted AAA+ superfamily ATPase